ncbi:uncharacterized protein LOC131687230 [Topomyia yanbarensis]|uniref:uncharacterized protein LOC131687230 n=1 Tax=Topomyia yanbarensis TaxID=2498891 RepID=UPI00273C3D2F|nr:uncharacterized protein LOC131687230 [Topomyia yanbarensis]
MLENTYIDSKEQASVATELNEKQSDCNQKTREDSNIDDSVSNNGTENGVLLINNQIRNFQTIRAPELIRFGPEQEVAIACKDRVLRYNYSRDTCHNLKPTTVGDSCTAVSSLVFNNSTTGSSQLLVGHGDGVVRLWQSNTLTNVWQALYDPVSRTPSTAVAKGLVMSAYGKTLFTAGDAKYLRSWDLEAEQMIGDTPTGIDEPVTAIVCHNHHNVALGFASGKIRIFDTRTNSRAASKTGYTPPILKSVRTMSVRNNQVTLVSASATGLVHVLDLRKLAIPLKQWSFDGEVSDVAIHDRLQLVAGAGELIDVRTIDGEELYKIHRMEGTGGAGEGTKKRPPSCLVFHPNEALICAGYNDNTAVLYADRSASKHCKV